MRRARSNSGQAQIEFALCAVFVIFLLISMVDLARGLWINHTLAEAVRDGTRYAMVRGNNYVDKSKPPARLSDAKLSDVRQVVLRSAVGLSPGELNLRFESEGSVINCPGSTCPSGTLTQNWPPDSYANGGLEIGISATYPYRSLVVIYFPGIKGFMFGAQQLGSVARERIPL